MSEPLPQRTASGQRSRRLWLITGLILFAYIVTHLLNHAMGLFGLGAMDVAQGLFVRLWHNPFGTALLYGALAIHFLLALHSVYARRHFRMRARDAVQLILGLMIPPLLAGHLIDTRVAFELFNTIPTYERIILAMRANPEGGIIQTALLLVAWVHGCIGLHFWLRLKTWYAAWVPAFLAGAILLPVLALLGVVAAMREVSVLAQQPGWIANAMIAAHNPTSEVHEILQQAAMKTRALLGASLVLALLAGAWRNWYERRHQSIRITYPGGRKIVAPRGLTVLDISRANGVPHASVCGGRGRCSTCRIRVLDGINLLPAAAAGEQAVLTRVRAGANVRLACQLRPIADLAIMPLMPPGLALRDFRGASDYLQGDEREICVLFADLRGFTRFSERKLPYDIVFFLNRYFETMGGAIEKAGGVTNQFTGDGVMALFGIERGAERGCREAIQAAAAMVEGLAQMSADLSADLDEPLRMGIGIHCGQTVVGQMGRGVASYLTAVGDTVHVASRLQDLTKEFKCSTIISEVAARRAGIDVEGFPRHEITVRNRSEPIAIRAVDDPRKLVLADGPRQ